MPGPFENACEHLPAETAGRLRQSADAMKRLFGPEAAVAHLGWCSAVLATLADDRESRLALEALARECGRKVSQTQGGGRR
jgi:hypothetical protein